MENAGVFIGKKDYSYWYRWKRIRMAGKKQNMASMRRKLMNLVDLDEPTSFFDHVFFGMRCSQCVQLKGKTLDHRRSDRKRVLPGEEMRKPR